MSMPGGKDLITIDRNELKSMLDSMDEAVSRSRDNSLKKKFSIVEKKVDEMLEKEEELDLQWHEVGAFYGLQGGGPIGGAILGGIGYLVDKAIEHFGEGEYEAKFDPMASVEKLPKVIKMLDEQEKEDKKKK